MAEPIDAFTEWRNSTRNVARLALLSARLTILLRKSSKTESLMEDVLSVAEEAYAAGILHAQENPNAR